MPFILINFGEERKVYNAPNKPVPWQKVVNIDVGKAPTVDVFFKNGTLEIRVKTFKFVSEKSRCVSVTINVDANNTVTAKLVALNEFRLQDKNDSENEGMIVMLNYDSTAAAFTRTDGMPLFSPTSLSGSTGEQYDAAAATAARAVPPSEAASVFIVHVTANHKYAVRKRMVQALETAGYSNVRSVDQYSPLLSTALQLAKPNKTVGEYVAIGEIVLIHVVQKTENGYDFVQTVVGMDRLQQLFPTIKEVISMLFAEIDDDETLRMCYRPLPVKVAVTIPTDYLVPYMWNKHDGGNMDGYLVTMTVQCKFRINYNGKNTVLDARTEMLPWQKTVEIDIGEATTVDIFMHHVDVFDKTGEVLVKQFKFTSKKNRKVSISIAIDDARLPEVTLTSL